MKDYINKSGYYRIKVIPNSSITEFKEIMDDGTIKISINAPREKGKANKELIKFLSSELSISKDQISISSGLTSPIKVISINL